MEEQKARTDQQPVNFLRLDTNYLILNTNY